MESGQANTGLAERLHERFGDALARCGERDGHVTCDVRPGALLDVCQVLRDAPGFAFEQLMDLCGVDFSAYGLTEWGTSESATNTGFSRGVERRTREAGGAPPEEAHARFAVVYQLLSVSRNERLTVRCFLPDDPPRVASVVDIWSSANWNEREAFDLFGILFEGHPDLRRILTDYGFVGHPFRKDFPLTGEVEMRYDPEKRRVVYESVSIEPRTLVPRVIRHDNRYHRDAAARSGDDPGTADA